MKLLSLETQKEIEAEILELEEKDYEKIKKSRRFEFDWANEREHHVFKIVKAREENPEILGLISIVNIPEEFRIHVNLIENSKENKGKHKKIDRIAGCLLAFAAQVSFEKGYLGFTSLVPKTTLIELYVKKYGFTQYSRQLAIERQDAINLIQKYL
ncbi:MAG: hypothetical protein KDD10_16690 [Phaeodactylibacter sp.]|nr:hypothetical protein [Phaeodactylibacter sp.]